MEEHGLSHIRGFGLLPMATCSPVEVAMLILHFEFIFPHFEGQIVGSLLSFFLHRERNQWRAGGMRFYFIIVIIFFFAREIYKK